MTPSPTLTLEELQLALAEAAGARTLDINRIQELAIQMADLKSSQVRFTTDAGIINRLGQELVGKQETAVAELIKNAYDADAIEVNLIFSDTASAGGTLVIEDNGLGMTKEQLLNGFMRISSNDKLINPLSTRYGRRRAGRKGIGRFAVQRLGRTLILTTQTTSDEYALRLTIDWDAFRTGVDLNSVTSNIDQIPKDRSEGTTLSIEGLRESWSEAEIRRVYRYVSDVLQPFPLDSSKQIIKNQSVKPGKYKTDPGFSVVLKRQSNGWEETIASQNDTIFANALAVFNGHVNDKGKAYWSIKSERLDINEEADIGPNRNNNASFSALRNVSFRAYYYIWLPEFFPKLLFTPLVELGRQQGGIRVFRNDFRVSPYGDRDDDWLGLDYSQGNRVFLPPHGNQNFFGFVELDDPNGELFEERASREGLIENTAFLELRDFIYTSVIGGIQRVAEIRNKKRTAGQVNWQQKDNISESLVDKTKNLVEKVRLARQTTSDAVEKDDYTTVRAQVVLDDIATAVEDLNIVVQAADEKQSQLLEELGMLRVLASLGLVIGEFTHEIRQTLNAAQVNALNLAETLPRDTREYLTLEHLILNLQRLRTYASYFDRTVADNSNREVAHQELRSIARNFIDAVKDATKRMNISIAYEAYGYELFTPLMHASEISSLLFNFYSNSLKAIKRRGKEGKMLLRVGSENNRVYLEFADTGDGILESIQDRIFNAFFTTAGPANRSSSLDEEAQGSGLGLKIVSDIVTAHQGDIFLTEPPSGYETCFRVEFPSQNSNGND